MSMTTGNTSQLRRSEIWSADLKETLKDELDAMKWVHMLDGFPDGDQFTMPSIGDSQVDDYVEDQSAVYRPIDTGEWTFSISEYLSSGNYITKKAMQDSFYSKQVVSSFVPNQQRAIMEHVEANILAQPEAVLGATANGQYLINGAPHRYAGGNAGRIEVADFAYAKYALKKANVPMTNLVAIVDPSVAFTLETLSNLVDVSNNPRWEGIVADGMTSGMRFVRNVYGFDVYESNYLTDVNDSALRERDQSTTKDYSSDTGKANIFFSADSDITPFVMAWRQMPEVDEEYDMDFQRFKYLTTARYGKGLRRPENCVIVASDTDVS